MWIYLASIKISSLLKNVTETAWITLQEEFAK